MPAANEAHVRGAQNARDSFGVPLVEKPSGHYEITAVWFLSGRATPTTEGSIQSLLKADADTTIKREGQILIIDRRKTQTGRKQRLEVHCSQVVIDSHWVDDDQ